MREIKPYDNNGSIHLRFTFQGKRYSFAPISGAKWGDKIAIAKVEIIVKQIKLDILSGNFDVTLAKYRDNQASQLKQPLNKPAQVDLKKQDNKVNEESIILLDLFNQYYESRVKEIKENSTLRYGTVIRKLKKCPYKTIGESILIIDWLKDTYQGEDKQNLVDQCRFINSAINYAVKRKQLSFNPFSDFEDILNIKRKKSEDGYGKAFTIEERDFIIRAFYASPRSSYYAHLVEFLFLTGCRPNEALPVQWGDVDETKGIITFSRSVDYKRNIQNGLKTQDSRELPLYPKLSKLLSKIKTDATNPTQLLFPSVTGDIINWNNFLTRHWKPIFELLPDIEYRSPYKTRHTAITAWVHSGEITPVAVAQIVGNSPNVIYKNYLGKIQGVSVPNL